MQRMTIVAMAAVLVAPPAFSQGAGQAAGTGATGTAPHQANSAMTAPTIAAHAAPAKPAVAASTPESRSAAALALSHDPTYDESSAQRIREAALSYSDLAVRGGWPAIPADAKFTLGTHARPQRRGKIVEEGIGLTDLVIHVHQDDGIQR